VTIVPENGGRVTLRREVIGEILYDDREPRQITTKELVDGFTHCVSRLAGREETFRLVKVTPEAIYLNLGSVDGARPGLELNVYREGDEIVDPETGQTLGREKSFVGILQIVGVENDYSKAVPVHTAAGKFQEGDTGVFLRESPVLAVAGITALDGGESPYGSLVAEQIIGKLNQNPELKVVERKQLGQILRELAIQNALSGPGLPAELPSEVQKRQMTLEAPELKEGGPPVVLDEGMAEKLRKLQGADALIVGTVADVNGHGAVNLRLVDTSTAAVLFSTHKMVGNPEKPIQQARQEEEKGSTEPTASEKTTTAEPVSRSTKGGPDLLDRILRAVYQR
jgi:TolB-like protein